MNLDVFALPELAPRDGYDLFICIDVLRATTTITTALANGAQRVIPFATVDETFAARDELLTRYVSLKDKILLGGERKGLPLQGFDLGNSPELYQRGTVEGKTLLFTTTNGTKTILHSSESDLKKEEMEGSGPNPPKMRKHREEMRKDLEADQRTGEVCLASFINSQTVADYVLRSGFDKTAILCAGTESKFTEEDLLLAGRLVDLIASSCDCRKNVQAEDVLNRWRGFVLRSIERSGQEIDPDLLLQMLEESRGGQNLLRIGLKKDIAYAAKVDSCPVLPICHNGEIILK